MRRLGTIAIAAGLVLGCKSAEEKSCEHARDTMVAWQRAAFESLFAANDVDEAAQKELRGDLEKMEAGFVQRCMGLPQAGKECVARVDEVAKRIDALSGEMNRCQSEGTSTTCKTDYVEQVEALMPECDATFDALVKP